MLTSRAGRNVILLMVCDHYEFSQYAGRVTNMTSRMPAFIDTMGERLFMLLCYINVKAYLLYFQPYIKYS